MACSRLATLLALPVAVSLMLGAAPRPAQGGLCQQRGLPDGCVDSADVQDNSLGVIEFKDEAGFRSNSKSGPGIGKLGTVVNLDAPRRGWAIVMASVDLEGFSGAATSTVRCVVVAKRSGATFAVRPFFGSVNPKKQVRFTSMAATLGFKVEKGKTGVTVSCKRFSGPRAIISNVDLIVQYFPTKY